MISFTDRFIAALLAGAAGYLAAYWVPGAIWVAAFFNAACALLALFDALDARPEIFVRRVFDPKLSLGEPATIGLEVRMEGGYPLLLEIEDAPPDGFRSEGATARLRLSPHSTARAQYRTEATRRGRFAFGSPTVRFPGRLGLVRKRVVLPAADEVDVYPNLRDLKKIRMYLHRKTSQIQGIRQSRLAGQGSEFEKLREYTPDDEFSRVNWKATARRGRLISTDYQTDRNQRVMIAIDAGRRMGANVDGRTKFDCAVGAAVALAYAAAFKGDRVGLIVFSDGPRLVLPPGRGEGQAARVMESLYRVFPDDLEPDYRAAMDYFLKNKRSRSMLVIFSDFMDPDTVRPLVRDLAVLRRAHLPLCVSLADRDVTEAAGAIPVTSTAFYEKSVAMGLLDARRDALRRLRAVNVPVVEADPARVGAETVNKYLELKGRLLF